MRPGRVSHTALSVARLVLYFGLRPPYAALMPDGSVQKLQELLEALDMLPRWQQRLMGTRLAAGSVAAADWLAGGGAKVHFPLRKRFVEDQVRQAIDAGAGQLLVIGAGLDVLAARLSTELPTLRAVEVDHPATGEAKARGLTAIGLRPPNLELVPMDLAAHPLAAALAKTLWQPGPSAVVAEGLLMYLPQEAVEGLFRALHDQTGPGSCVVFTWLPEGADGVRLDPYTRRIIAWAGEPVEFSCTREDLEALLAPLGWVLRPAVDLRATYLADGPLADAPITQAEALSVADWVAAPET